jgi:hypothetical protein
MASTLARLESSGVLPVRTSKALVYEAPVHNKEATAHCECLSDYPQLHPNIFKVNAALCWALASSSVS